jgi:hypothetical protein
MSNDDSILILMRNRWSRRNLSLTGYLQDIQTPVIKDDDLNLTEVDLQDPCTYF